MTEETLQNDDENWLIDDDVEVLTNMPVRSQRRPWKVMIVDDEKDVHSATRLAIQEIRFKDRGLLLLNAFTGSEGFDLISAHPDTALILLDVVMETDDAGLRLVHRIRHELNNQTVRIVLCTGQPGMAPEQDVILNYDINDYKSKTELTEQKMFTTVISSLRAYENMMTIEKTRQGLAKILEGASDLYQLRSLQAFASGVLKQVSVLLDVGLDGVICVGNGLQHTGPMRFEVIAATGSYEHLAHSNDFSDMPELATSIRDAFLQKKNIYRHPYDVLYIAAKNAHEFVVHFYPPCLLEDIERNLLEVFCLRISAAYDNLYLYLQLCSSQKAAVVALADLAEYRDPETGGHVLRVQQLVEALTAELTNMKLYGTELTSEFMEMIGLASILHDAGKIATPDQILFKPGKLGPDERKTMEQHAMIGAQILQKACALVEGHNYLELGSEIAAAHHEHYDGNGYPQHLRGDRIPLAARIVAVADVFDALLSLRPYKEPWTLAATMDYIRKRAGSQFDPNIAAALLKLIEEYRLPFKIDNGE